MMGGYASYEVLDCTPKRRRSVAEYSYKCKKCGRTHVLYGGCGLKQPHERVCQTCAEKAAYIGQLGKPGGAKVWQDA